MTKEKDDQGAAAQWESFAGVPIYKELADKLRQIKGMIEAEIDQIEKGLEGDPQGNENNNG